MPETRRNIYLFNDHLPELMNPIDLEERNYEEEQKIADDYRKSAIVEIYGKVGINGICQLIDRCKLMGLVGYSIANSDLRGSIENVVLDWLDSENDKLVYAARSYVLACSALNDSWVAYYLENSFKWSKVKFANFLLGLPFNKETIELVRGSEIEVSKLYWEKVNAYHFIDDEKANNWVIEQLLKSGRPLAAIDFASRTFWRRQQIAPDSKLIVDVLTQIALTQSDKDQIPISRVQHEILQAISYLQEQETISKNEIAQIEWMYLKIFRFENVKPKYLESEVLEKPEFFSQLISWIFKSDEVQNDSDGLDEEMLKLRASNAWELLDTISDIPGQDGGKVDGTKLKDWVFKSRELINLSGRGEIGDRQIGKILSNSPPGKDGVWPHEEVREIVEAIKSSELEDALRIGRMNARGVVSRSPLAGGEVERNISTNYKKQADTINFQWPRTARMLRQIANFYEHEAVWEDNQFQLRE